MDRELIKKLFDPFPTLYTDRMILRRIRPSDARDMFEYSSDAEVTKYLTWEPHPNISFTRRHIKTVERAYRDVAYFDFALELNTSCKMVGTCGFTSFNYSDKSCELGYVINPRFNGYSLATEASERLIEYAFDVIGADSVFARCMVENDASRRVMEKCGMIYVRDYDREVSKQNVYRRISEYRITKERYVLRRQDVTCGI